MGNRFINAFRTVSGEQDKRQMLLELEQRILADDERLVAAQRAIHETRDRGLGSPEMKQAEQLLQETLTAMTLYRDLLLASIRSVAAGLEHSD